VAELLKAWTDEMPIPGVRSSPMEKDVRSHSYSDTASRPLASVARPSSGERRSCVIVLLGRGSICSVIALRAHTPAELIGT
jgi:hypothetical protein